MIPASLSDLDTLDPGKPIREALKALVLTNHSESARIAQGSELNSHEIEHFKMVVEKYRRIIFGHKSELTRKLGQLEFRLEELETAEAANKAAKQSA